MENEKKECSLPNEEDNKFKAFKRPEPTSFKEGVEQLIKDAK